MTDTATPHRVDLELLSAYLDGEMNATEQNRMAAHLAACRHCAAVLSELRDLSAQFERLPQDRLGYDLAGVIAGQLEATGRLRFPVPHRVPWWRLLPVSLGAAASIALGGAMGTALFGSAIAAPRVAAMSVFDPLPPGSLCLGLESCYLKGVRK